MDAATLIGIISAFALVITAIMMGSGLSVFFDVHSLMIVFGGTFGATMINYPIRDVLGVFKVVKHVFFSRIWSSQELISRFLEFSRKARRDGLLGLEPELLKLNDPFLIKGLQLAIDGVEPEAIREILDKNNFEKIPIRGRMTGTTFNLSIRLLSSAGLRDAAFIRSGPKIIRINSFISFASSGEIESIPSSSSFLLVERRSFLPIPSTCEIWL